MAKPSPSNPLGYIVKREYADRSCFGKTLLRERLNSARSLYRKDLLAHYGCVNAIEFSNKGDLLVSGGDDRRVLIWDVEQAVHSVGKPSAMRAQHISNIFCLGFDSTNSKVFSAGNDDQVIVHDVVTGDPVNYFLHEQPVYGLSIDPLNDNVFASACDDGRVLLYDIREPASSEPFCLASYTSSFHAVMFNPLEPRILTTANSKEGVGLWDVRKPCQILMKYGNQNISQSCMSVRFNQNGSHILALRRRLPPVLYAIHSSEHVCQFDHAGYYNSCTMKSCCFAGEDDEYVLSGSDDFGLYVWKIPASDRKDQWIGEAHMILRGHRSIVNQVRFNPASYIIASSGVEKLIKFWSPFALPESSGSLIKENETSDGQRKVFTHEEYISLVLRSGQFMTHDYSHQSTKEDPRMMAFFDSLVQREIEGWSTDDSASTELSVRDVAGSASDSESVLSDTPVTALTAALVEAFEGQGNNDSSEPSGETNEAQPVDAQNRISQLIARKRAQLIRLARSRYGEEGEPSTEPHSSQPCVVQDSSDSSDSGRERSPSTEENPDARNNNTTTDGKLSECEQLNGKAGSSSSKNKCVEHKNNGDSRKRRTRYVQPLSDSSEDEDWNTNQKRRKKRPSNWLSNHSDSDVGESSVVNQEKNNAKSSSKHQNKILKKCREKGSDSDSSSSDGNFERKRHLSYMKRKLSISKSERLSNANNKRPALKHKGKSLKRKARSDKVEKLDALSDNSDISDSCNNENEAIVPSESTDQEALAAGTNAEHKMPSTPNGKICNGLEFQDIETPDSGIVTTGSPFSRPASNNSNGSVSPSHQSPVHQEASCSSQVNGSSESHQNSFVSSENNGAECGSSRNASDVSFNDDRSWMVFQRIKNRMRRMQRNFRKRIEEDSDSN